MISYFIHKLIFIRTINLTIKLYEIQYDLLINVKKKYLCLTKINKYLRIMLEKTYKKSFNC